MLLTGQATTTRVSGQKTGFRIDWTYPNSNPPTYNSIDQPTEPPVELSDVEFRFTDNDLCLTDPENKTIYWEHRFHGTGDQPTADYINNQWVGYDDSSSFNNFPVRAIWYYQARCWSRAGVPSDWTEIYQIVDAPDPLPTPEIISIKTNDKDQVRLEWLDVGAEIVDFSHYEIVKEEIDVTRRLETNAVIVGES